MTTGRINQVTIVRRGWPSPCKQKRRTSYWGATRRVFMVLAGQAIESPKDIRFSPPNSPERRRQHTAANYRWCLNAPRGGPNPLESAIQRLPAGGYLLLLCISACQRPDTHKAHRSTLWQATASFGRPVERPQTAAAPAER